MANLPTLSIQLPSDASGSAAIVEAVALQLREGRLPSGCRLPPVRVLAHQLGFSKNTVQAAYDELAAQGLTESRGRKGVFVKAEVPASSAEPALPDFWPGFAPRPKGLLPLSSVMIDPQLLPAEQLTTCFRAVLDNPGMLPDYEPQGYLPLREAIAERLDLRGIQTSAEEVIITLGAQQALDITCRALKNKRIATESPAYAIGKRLFEMSGVESCGLPIDPFRRVPMDVWRSRLEAFKPAMLYLTTNFQNPTGYSYTTSELMELAEFSQQLGFGIIEDDWGSDMLSFSEFRPPLRALVGTSVLYMNSFTKKLLPSLRLGFLVADKRLVPSLVGAKRVSALGNPILPEMALHEFLARGHYDRHLQKLQPELDRRYQRALELLAELMPDWVRWTRPGGGPLIWLNFPDQIDLEALGGRLSNKGVGITLDTERFFETPHLHGFPLGFAYLTSERLERGLRVLAEELKKGN